MSLGLAPFLYCHCQSLGSDLPQISVGLLQSLLAGIPNTHLSHFQSATDTLLLRAGLVTSLCCLTIAHGPPSCPWLPFLWHSQPFLLYSLQVASHSPVTLGTLAVSQGLFTVPQLSLPFPTLILLFTIFWFLGRHTCFCLSGQLLLIHGGWASLLPSPREHSPCCSPSPGSKHVPSTLFSQEFVHTCLTSLTTLCLFSSIVEAQERALPILGNLQ